MVVKDEPRAVKCVKMHPEDFLCVREQSLYCMACDKFIRFEKKQRVQQHVSGPKHKGKAKERKERDEAASSLKAASRKWFHQQTAAHESRRVVGNTLSEEQKAQRTEVFFFPFFSVLVFLRCPVSFRCA